jgi:hypothetical protein
VAFFVDALERFFGDLDDAPLHRRAPSATHLDLDARETAAEVGQRRLLIALRQPGHRPRRFCRERRCKLDRRHALRRHHHQRLERVVELPRLERNLGDRARRHVASPLEVPDPVLVEHQRLEGQSRLARRGREEHQQQCVHGRLDTSRQPGFPIMASHG